MLASISDFGEEVLLGSCNFSLRSLHIQYGLAERSKFGERRNHPHVGLGCFYIWTTHSALPNLVLSVHVMLGLDLSVMAGGI